VTRKSCSLAHIALKAQNEAPGQYTPRGPSAPPGHPVRPKPMNRVDRLTRVLSDTASYVTQGSPVLELLRERGYTAPRDPSLTESMSSPLSRDTSLCESMFGVHKLTACDLHRCVLCFISPYLQVLIFLYPRYEGNTDPAFGSLHVCDREEHHR